MYEKAFTRYPTGTPVAAREPKISVEIKYYMTDHGRDQTRDQVNRSESSTQATTRQRP
jgi:hypothetical protein